MLSILLVALVAQAEPRDTITTEDVQAIMQTVLDSVAPSDGTIAGRPVAGRPIIVDAARSVQAFQEELLPETALTLSNLGRSYSAQAEGSAISCRSGEAGVRPGTCEVLNDGIFVSVLSANRTDTAGEYLLNVRVRWTDPSERFGNQIHGYDMEMFFSRVDREWQIVRNGVARVI
jgi:hypothetical protein